MVPVAGEQSSDARLRERIDFTSNLLFFIEDLFLAVGQGAITTKAGVKLNMSASLSWVRNQLAGSVKELMIAKKAGWKVLQNFKNQVFLYFYIGLFSVDYNEPFEGGDSFEVLFDTNDSDISGCFILDFSTDLLVIILLISDIPCPRSTCRHVDLSLVLLL